MLEQTLAEQDTFKTALQSLNARAVITPALVILNCAAFAFTVAMGAGLMQPDGAALVKWGTNYGPLTLEGEWWRLFTSLFLHFGLLHLLFNMWALWSLGQITEKLYGSVYFLVLYIFAGLCGSVASLLWHPDINSAGASGAIFGVIGGLLAFMMNPKTRVPASVASAQRSSALVFIAYNLFNGFAHAGIDNAAHIGGLAGGLCMGWWLARPLYVESRQSPAPRLLACALAGTAILVAVSWPLAHPSPIVVSERKFRHQFELFADQERQIVALQTQIDQLATDRKITQEEWGRRIATEVLPKWQLAEAQISSTQLAPKSHLIELRTALIDYLDQKRDALNLQSDGAQHDDPEKLLLGNAEAQRNQVTAKILRLRVQRQLR